MLTMTEPSYIAAVTTDAPIVAQYYSQDLYSPPPTSMTLVAALMLLENPLLAKTKFLQVYLMPVAYLQNWLTWAYHQPVPQDELRRLQRGLRLAAEAYKLTKPKLNDDFHHPGPVNCSLLSDDKYPLVLRENVVVWDGEVQEGKTPCCAVPERFYELLRSVHGVLCEDTKSISFQQESSDILIQHHDPSRPKNGHVFPIEFRRQVVLERRIQTEESPPKSPMEKLMDKDTGFVPVVEIYPKKLAYSIVDDDNTTKSFGGFILASKGYNVVDVLHATMRMIAPQKSSSCVRIWSKRQALRQDGKSYATRKGDGFELVDLENMDGHLQRNDIVKVKSNMTVEEWITRQGASEIMVESRLNTASPWPRASMELENRIEVGDFVDAQDTTGKWYEAIVRDVTDDVVIVHYSGWASRWNGKVRRRNNGKTVLGAAMYVNAPAPLWTHVPRWRENIKIGDFAEIRDSTSHVTQPKWFRGTIRKIGRKDKEPHDLYDGAMLEKLEPLEAATNGKGRNDTFPLYILRRTQQVLVEIPQEKQNNPALVALTSGDDQEENPPYIRWVSLYGEEICAPGTHMKIEAIEKRPCTVNYDFDTRKPPVEVLKSHLHGAGFVRESLRGNPPAPGSVGLQNLGNSCFMNSIIQCFNHCEPVTNYFLQEEYAVDLNKKNPLGSGGRVAMAHASLLCDIWGGQYSVLAPRLLKQTIANFAPQFNNVYQHDSHEFCSFLMDGIHEDCNRVKSKPYVEDLEGFGVPDQKMAIESWRRHLLRHDSIIVDRCQGMHRSHLTCPMCGRESIKFDVFSSLSLPLIPSKDRVAIPLDDCLEKFTEGEQLDDSNAWYCPNCKKHVCALKMLALWTLPDVLIMHLKRFTYETRNGRVVRSKIEDKVEFPIDHLDMRPYVLGPIDEEAPPIYNLFGVSEHSGTTANSGHYTATVRNSKDGKWYRYNDSHVGSSSGEASVTGGAYLLFYKRAKGAAKWGGMEKIMDELEIDPHGALETDVDGFKEVKTKKKTKKRAT